MQSIEQNWDAMAAAYEAFTDGEDSYSNCIEWPCVRPMLPALAGKRALDLGCGTGRFTFWLEELGAQSVTGVDVSESMLRLASEKAAKRGSQAVFQKADASAFSSPTPFDLVFSSTLTHYLPDLNCFFQSVSKLLSADGVCVLSVMHPVYTAQYPVLRGERFPADEEWTVRYLDRRERGYVQPWIEYNDDVPNFLSASYHHTFADYGNAVLGAGLRFERLEEPLPPESWKETMPERYEGFVETPGFLVMKLKKA